MRVLVFVVFVKDRRWWCGKCGGDVIFSSPIDGLIQDLVQFETEVEPHSRGKNGDLMKKDQAEQKRLEERRAEEERLERKKC